MADSTVPPPAPAPGQRADDTPLAAVDLTPADAPPATKKPAAVKKPATKPTPAPAAVVPVEAAIRADPYGAAVPPAAPAAPAPAVAYDPSYAGAPAAPTATLSVLSLVFGIMGLVLGFFLLGMLPAIAGVILGHLALKREPHGRGMAVAGLVTGYIGLAISILWGIMFLGLTLLPIFILGTAGLGASDFGF